MSNESAPFIFKKFIRHQTVSDLLMISNNGPPLRDFAVRKYVVSWLKSGRHDALDKATGIPAEVQRISKNAKLFSIVTILIICNLNIIFHFKCNSISSSGGQAP